MNAILRSLRSLLPSSRDPAMREPSVVRPEPLTVDQRPPLREPPPRPGDMLGELRREKRHLRTRMDEVELLIDCIENERRLRGLPT